MENITCEEWMKQSYYDMRDMALHHFDINIRYNPFLNPVRPLVKCGDGTIISIQGSSLHESIPNAFTTSYKSVEIGLMHKEPILDKSYFARATEFCEGSIQFIYGCVFMKDAEELISLHKGIKEAYFRD